MGDGFAVEVSSEFGFAGFDSLSGKGHKPCHAAAMGFQLRHGGGEVSARDEDILARAPGPANGAVNHGGSWRRQGSTQDGDDGEVSLVHGDLGPKGHLREEILERVELRCRDIEEEGVAREHQIHVVQHVALYIEVRGAGGKACLHVIEFLTQQIVEKSLGIRT